MREVEQMEFGLIGTGADPDENLIQVSSGGSDPPDEVTMVGGPWPRQRTRSRTTGVPGGLS